MQRDEQAYLGDILDSCGAIESWTQGVDFRNRLTHTIVDNVVVWGIDQNALPLLRQECTALLKRLE